MGLYPYEMPHYEIRYLNSSNSVPILRDCKLMGSQEISMILLYNTPQLFTPKNKGRYNIYTRIMREPKAKPWWDIYNH